MCIMTDRRNIAVIGVGQLGRRHLQSLCSIRDEFNIWGVETNPLAIDTLRSEFGDSAVILEQMDSLPEEIEVCIISTGADVRRRVFENLTERKTVKNILFEKVLFQRLDDYSFVSNRLMEKGIKAWVNCARREWDSYKWLKREMADVSSFTYCVSGGGWGLCCNGIHMLDLMLFLGGDQEFDMDQSVVSSTIEESKRKGFYELYGTLAGKADKCRYYQISCMEHNNPSFISISSDIVNAIIDEGKQKVLISRKIDDWMWQEMDFPIVYQSQLSAQTVKRMLDGTCNLPVYDLSMREHLIYISKLQEFFVRNGWEDRDLCPIT